MAKQPSKKDFKHTSRRQPKQGSRAVEEETDNHKGPFSTTKPTTRICIKNVPPSIQTTDQVKQFLFQSHQAYFATDASSSMTITDCRLLSKRHLAFVGFTTTQAASQCVRYLHATYWKTTKIVVEFAIPPAAVAAAQKKKEQEKNVVALQTADNSKVKPEDKGESQEALKEKKKEDFLNVLGSLGDSSKKKGAFWSNDDALGSTTRQQQEMATRKFKASKDDGDDSTSSSSSDDDGEADSADDSSSQDDAEPLMESNKTNMSDLDFLRSKTVQAEELPEDANHSHDKQEDEGDDNDEKSEDQAVAMKADTPGKSFPEETTHPGDEPDEEDSQPELSSKRLFVRNLPFSVTEDDLMEYFSRYGTLDECHVPVDDQHRSKGFGFVSFQDPDRAQQVRDECDGTDFQGRIIHVLPARAQKSTPKLSVAEPSTYKEKQELEKQSRAGKDQTGWSASFVRGDAVVDNLASRLGLRKGDVLGVKDGLSAGDAAVRLALGETAIIEENRKFFSGHGIDMEALVSMPKGGGQPLSEQTVDRSKTSILVKNLPADTNKEELLKTFGSTGVNPSRILLPPSRTIAVMEYAHANEAKSVFKKLAYRRFRDVPLYLEWAPLSAQIGGTEAPKTEEAEMNPTETMEESAEDSLSRAARPTLYVKNLNFATTEDDLLAHFRFVSDDVKAVRIPQKTAPAKLLAGNIVREEKLASMGFGFVEFGSKAAAAKALEQLQGKLLAGHPLLLEPTKQSGQSQVPIDAKRTKSSKLMVRNVPFQANRKELLTLFGSFGQLKKLRLPKKFDGNHRGFAFVDYVSSKEAAEAMKTLSRTHFYGRHLVIEWAEDEPETSGVKIQTESVQPQNKRKKFTY